MVFESIVVDLVNRFLGDYIDNLDKSQLSLGLWGGDVVLNNLFVKENLLDEFDLPIKIVLGNLGQLKLKIPWKNLYSEPTIAQLDGLYILAVPNSSVSYNEEKESKNRWDSKQKELARIEEAKKNAEEKALAPASKQDSFAEKLATNVIKNLEVTITNIHIRYEDSVTNPGCPFSVGVSLKELFCHTDAGRPATSQNSGANVIYKVVKMDGLAVYWNCGLGSYVGQPKGAIQKLLKENIGCRDHKANYHYLIEPVTSAAQLQFDMKPDKDAFLVPKIFTDVIFEEIGLALSKNQYQLLMEFLESLERMKLADRYRKYHPNVSKRGHSKEWWHFAYTCILEETVKRKRKMWSWSNMVAHRKLCNEYKYLYKTKLLTSKPSPDLLANVERLEKQLDVFNITLMRQQAEIAAKKEGVKKKESESGGWFGGWFGRGKKTEVPEVKEVEAKIQEIMTSEEKQKLYDAIGYEENVEIDFPKDYIAVKLHLHLKSLLLKLKDASAKQQVIMNLKLSHFDVNLGQRPAASAICIEANMESLQLCGALPCEGATLPVMLTSFGAMNASRKSERFVSVLFETNPLDGACDVRMSIMSQPLDITYDARTIILLADFFKPPEAVYVVQLQAAAMAKLESMRKETAVKLQQSLYQQRSTEVNICVHPTCILIPEQGIYRPNCRMIVLDLGELCIVTEKNPNVSKLSQDGELTSPKLSLADLKVRAFNKFNAHLKSVQVLFANSGENWLEARTKTASHLHVLNPLGVNVEIFQCTVIDADLPRLKIIGELPALNIHLSDQRLSDILQLVVGIPLPEGSSNTDDDVDGLAQALQAPDVTLLPIREDVEELFAMTDAAPGVESAFVNAKELEVVFVVKEMCLSLSLEQGSQDVPALKFVVQSLGAQLAMCSFDMRINAFLGGIYLTHLQYQACEEVKQWSSGCGASPAALSDGVTLINTPVSDKLRLFTVDLILAQRRHPEFSTVYQNTLNQIKADFSSLEVLLHQDALLDLINVLQTFQAAVEKSQPVSSELEKSKKNRSSNLSLASVSSTLNKLDKRRVRKKPSTEIIDVCINAKLGEVRLALSTSDHLLADMKISGLDTCITVQHSQTVISASLKDISVFDHLPNTLYPNILSFDERDVFNMHITVFNDATTGKNYLDMTCIDTLFKLDTGCMRIVVLYRFVQDMLKYVSNFDMAKEKLREAGAAVTDQALATVQELSTRANRISLDVHLKAPVIVVPRSSQSLNVIVVDLGRLTVANRFQTATNSAKSSDGLPPVLDCMTVDLMEMKVFSALMKGDELSSECQLLKPVSLSVTVNRNLSSSWYHGHADIDISGRLLEISLIVSQGDMKTIFGILNENLKEGQPMKTGHVKPSIGKSESSDVVAAADVPDPKSHWASAGTLPPSTDELYSTLSLDFVVQSIMIELLTGDRDAMASSDERVVSESLAKFQLQKVGAKLDMKSDSSMSAEVLLFGCDLQDTRPNRQMCITRMITRSSLVSDGVDSSNMVDLSFKQDGKSNIDIVAKLNGLHIVLSVEYLLRLAEFFTDSMSLVPTKSGAHATTSKTVVKVPEKTEESSEESGKLTMRVSLNKPEIVLVEDSSKMQTNALVLTMEVEMSLRQSAVQQMLSASVKGLLLAYSTYFADKCTSITKSQLLQPVNMDLHSSAPQGKNHHVEVFVSDIIVNVTSSSVRTLTATLTSLASKTEEEEVDELAKIPKQLWAVRKIEQCNFYFLKAVESVEEGCLESGATLLNQDLNMEVEMPCERDEQLLLGKCRIVVTLSGSVGGRTIPFLITRMALSNIDIKNWSSLLSVTAELSLEVASYNNRLAVWEPVVEPVESGGRHRPWQISLKLQKNTLLSGDEDEVDAGPLPPPQMTIDVTSFDVLQLTVSKSSLDVFNNLAESFSDAYRQIEVASIESAVAPFIVKNKTGMHVSIKPDDSFQIPENTKNGLISIPDGHSCPLNIVSVDTTLKSSTSDFLYKEGIEEKLKKIQFIVEDISLRREIKVTKAETHAYSIGRNNFPGGNWQVISEVDASYGFKCVTLRSIVQVVNNFAFDVNIGYIINAETNASCGVAKPNEICCLPCDAAFHTIWFTPCVDGYTSRMCSFSWLDMSSSGETKILTCAAESSQLPTLYLAARVATEAVFLESTNEASAKSYKIFLSPAVVLCNLLPIDVSCHLEGVEKPAVVKAGQKTNLLHACPGQTTISLTMNYQSVEWTSHVTVDIRPQNLGVCPFEAFENGQKKKMDMGVHCELHHDGHRELSIYSSYWMINKTGKNLTYKASDNNIVSHRAEESNSVLLFMMKHSKSSSDNKVCLKIEDSDWSDKFSLDTVGSVGTVQTKVKDQTTMVGVKITLASNSLSKIVTFTPYYMLINEAKFAIQCKESTPDAAWLDIESEGCIPLWPTQTGTRKQLVARLVGSSLETKPFDITETHTTFLQLYHDYGGINVECVVAEGVIKVIFQHYVHGFATALLINHTIGAQVDYHQQDVAESRSTLEPGEVVFYTWSDPLARRELVWSSGESKNNKNELDQDGIGEFFADSDTKVYWVSFLDGAQRILLFTEDIAVATEAQHAGELERVEKEINVSLQGLGVSLINNQLHKEIAYMGIASSGIIWEIKKRRRYYPLTVMQNMSLEEGYQRYLTDVELAHGQKVVTKRALANGKIEVDFGGEEIIMVKPQQAVIRRSFNFGVWMQHRTSSHQTQLHIKVHQLQLDNQLAGAVFTTVLAPVPPPKTVAVESAPKPFAELSVMIRRSDYSDISQIKYCKLLVQEFAVKLDQGFISEMLALFESAVVNEEERRLAAFQSDCDLVNKTLMDTAAQTAAATIKNFYDELHFSPLKVHLSFSLYGADEAKVQWHMLNLFLESVGIVLTDIQDVVFKLGYFERKHKFYSQKQLVSEISSHYSQQAIKQMYVLVLGLDVLGNPFGVIRGLATGIEDLFYEPYQGAIQGPQEFAEGLAIGVKSLVGHAVGGAAGAVSRITGALGKGIATLTLDKDYQKKRREALNRRPADLKEGFARGGKGLVMGVFHGVTGIVMQPVEGAKQEGVTGFFKGVGKGLVGVFTRPASGVVDFASSSFEGIRRFTEMTEEVQRLRPSRFLQKDGIVRPFVYRDAQGNQLLQDVKRGTFSSDLYVGHMLLDAGERNALIATDKRVIFACKGEVLGQWDADWDYTWEQLREPPNLTQRGLQFMLKEKQKWLLGGSSQGKVVSVLDQDRQTAETLVGKMKVAMEAAAANK